MQLLKATILLAVVPAVLGATAVECHLGGNKCDDRNASVMVCGAHGWKAVESCYKDGACHVGTAGNAYCDKEVNCRPGEWKCDAAKYVSQFCNKQGIWQIDRKCSKFGCCEVRDGKAVCKPQCGSGKQPSAAGLSSRKATAGIPKPGDRCMSNGEGWCDEAHLWILRCDGNKIVYQERKCAEEGKCVYDNASLEPSCIR
jgi:hypothetical protein